MIDYRYDTQLLIEGTGLDEDAINDYFRTNFQGDCLLAVGDDELIKIHYHTNEPWKVLEYCASLGEIFDIVVEDHGPPGARSQRLTLKLPKVPPAFRNDPKSGGIFIALSRGETAKEAGRRTERSPHQPT